MERYEKFRSLLHEAMGAMTQKSFSEVSGISPEHLNRMLNNPEINRPSKKTLGKIVAASSLVNPKDLYESCGYTKADSYLGVERVRSSVSLRERMGLVVSDLESGFLRMKAAGGQYVSISDLMGQYLEKYSVEARKITYSVKEQEVPEAYADYGDCVVTCKACWRARKDSRHYYAVETYFALFYVKTSRGKLVLTGVTVKPGILLNLGFLPQTYIDMLVEDGTNPYHMPHFTIATEKYDADSPESRLLASIFGEDDEPKMNLKYPIWGRGSFYEKTPAGFLDYVLQNEQYFRESEEEIEILEEIQGKPLDEVDADAVCRDYLYDVAKGTVGVVLAILNRKLELEGCDFAVEYGESEEYEDVLKPVIYVSEDWYTVGEELDVHTRDLVDMALKAEMTALKMPTYGQTLVYKSYDVNPDDYVSYQEALCEK